jgi:hypothetical protein
MQVLNEVFSNMNIQEILLITKDHASAIFKIYNHLSNIHISRLNKLFLAWY